LFYSLRIVQVRQEWQQDSQLREELWKGQSQDPRGRPGRGRNDGHVPGVIGNRRPSPYREETAQQVVAGLAPPQGLDQHFDDRVRALQERRTNLRVTIWKKFGGSGEPALPGVVPAFDQTFEEVWGEIKQKEVNERIESTKVDFQPGNTKPRTPFDSDVAAEMSKIETELLSQLRSEARPNPMNAPSVYQTPQHKSPYESSNHPPQNMTKNIPFQYNQQQQQHQQYQQQHQQYQQQQQYHQQQQMLSSTPVQNHLNHQSQFQSNQQGDYSSTMGGSGQPLSARPMNGQQTDSSPLKSVPKVGNPFQSPQPPVTTRGRGQFSARGASSISFG